MIRTAFATLLLLSASAFAAGVTPNATRVPTLDGMPLAGPGNSDCQVYLYSGGTASINCPVVYVPVTGAHTVQPNEWGTVLVASGGGMVTITLPTMTTIGRNVVGFSTDGNTSITLIAQAPATMQGSSLIQSNGTLVAPPNSSGWAGLAAPNLFQVSFQ